MRLSQALKPPRPLPHRSMTLTHFSASNDASFRRCFLQIDREQRQLDGVQFWRVHGKEYSPHLRTVAQAVFGAPSSAGILERDFCVAEMFQSRKRGGMDPSNLEMVLYLRGQFDNIPDDVPQLTEEQAAEAVPRRFKDRKMVEEVEVLNYLIQEQDASESEEEDFSWEEKYEDEEDGDDEDEGNEGGAVTN